MQRRGPCRGAEAPRGGEEGRPGRSGEARRDGGTERRKAGFHAQPPCRLRGHGATGPEESDQGFELDSAVCCVTLGESSNFYELQVSHGKMFSSFKCLLTARKELPSGGAVWRGAGNVGACGVCHGVATV